MNMNRKNSNYQRIIVVALAIMAVVAVIVIMKRASDELPADRRTSPAAESPRMAVPDTSVAPGLLPASPDTVVPAQLPDTLLGRDKRPPFEAGYEDGYAAGCDDGAAATERAGYDESSTFALESERLKYAEGYKEGYAKGFADGKSGTQFGISGR